MDESLRRLFLFEIMMWSERVTQIEIAFKFLKTKAISYRHSKGIQMEGINPLSLSPSPSLPTRLGHSSHHTPTLYDRQL